jgi:peptidyl-prolyl cis-trans isomerase D
MSAAKSKTSKLLGGGLLGLLIVGLAGFGATNFSGNISSIGAVGDSEIDINIYARALQQELRAYEAQLGRRMTIAEAQIFGIDRQVISRLFAEAALDYETSRAGFSVGDQAVASQLRDIPAFNGLDGSFDRDAYVYTLEQTGLSVEEFEDGLRRQTARSIVEGAIMSGVVTPAPYSDLLMSWIGEQRSISWIKLTAADLAEGTGEPTEEALLAQYEATPEAWTVPAKRNLTYVWLSPSMLADTIELEENAAQSLYDERIEQYQRPERRLLERLVFGTEEDAQAARAAIDAGEQSFDDLVTGRGLNLADIDLGDVAKDDLDEAADAVFALIEPGIVGPVMTDIGPALFRMNGVLLAQITTFEEVRSELEAELRTLQARSDLSAQFTAIDDLLAGGATLEELSEETPMQLATLAWFDGAEADIAGFDAFNEAAALAAEGDFPEVIELADGGLAALRLDSEVAEFLQPLDEVKVPVIQAWETTETNRLLTARAEEIKSSVEGGEAFINQGSPVQTEKNLKRTEFIQGTPPAMLADAFELEAGALTVIEDTDGIILMQLGAITPADAADKDNATIRSRLDDETANSLSQDLFTAFTDAVRQDAGTTYDQAAINAVNASFP